VRVTGICRVETSRDRGFRSRPERVMLLLRGPEDLSLVKAPSWWTAGRLVAAIGLLSTLLTLVLLWTSLLRRQVARQAAALSERITRQATLEERQRIAREFHDTLEQELAGLNLRLDAALTRPLEDKARGLLDASRHLVARLQTEARNLVADLRAGQPDDLDLATELEEIVRRLPADGVPALRVQIDRPLPALPALVVHHLRMIAQEAVTNALKHAAATEIRLELTRGGNALVLRVTDDGRGLAPGATDARPGHFGCMGIRERCQKIGAEVAWLPGPDGHGTLVRLSLPCPDDDPTPA
jgi:signal transduction histidine kinase